MISRQCCRRWSSPAARLCNADKANVTRQIDGVFYRAESYGFSAEFMDRARNIPVEPDRGNVSGRALLEGRSVHIPDRLAGTNWVRRRHGTCNIAN